jgi:hypothetical protein
MFKILRITKNKKNKKKGDRGFENIYLLPSIDL